MCSLLHQFYFIMKEEKKVDWNIASIKSNLLMMDLFISDRHDMDVVTYRCFFSEKMIKFDEETLKNNIIAWFMIKYHFDDYFKKMSRSIEVDARFVSCYGNDDLLLYLKESGYKWDEWTCSSAALYGYLDCIKFLREYGCPWNEKSCQYASLNGHLEVLKYLHENGCPWNEKML